MSEIEGNTDAFTCLTTDELSVTPQEARAAVGAWQWLLGASTDAQREEARQEALSDAPLFVALHRPAPEFLAWWRGLDWGCVPRTDSDGDGWAWAVCDRARQLAVEAGPLAAEVSVAVLAASRE